MARKRFRQTESARSQSRLTAIRAFYNEPIASAVFLSFNLNIAWRTDPGSLIDSEGEPPGDPNLNVRVCNRRRSADPYSAL
jgi:hypothetical protein